ncbi:MAG: CDP-alcohol phosphatidyltransferase family protein [Clostridia bacterium]|nr:CDP-alcohol phosphatidyltransferase family protein [Clostridia bacterium]
MSIFRILLIPIIWYLYVVKEDYAFTAALVVLSGATDVVDGFIARKFNMISELGKFIDPIADKLTQAALIYCLISRFRNMLFVFILMAVKETLNAVSFLILKKKTGKMLSASWHGKLATVLLYAMLFLHIVWFGIPSAVSNIFIMVTAAAMVLSLVLYLVRNIKIVKKTTAKK